MLIFIMILNFRACKGKYRRFSPIPTILSFEQPFRSPYDVQGKNKDCRRLEVCKKKKRCLHFFQLVEGDKIPCMEKESSGCCFKNSANVPMNGQGRLLNVLDFSVG